LEDQFTCSLCYDIMYVSLYFLPIYRVHSPPPPFPPTFRVRACPYTLTPSQCGHSFCALCILKWFISRIHEACGTWHDPVECPICRSTLALTPPIPRPSITCPFTPNRALDTFLQNTINRLAGDGPSSKRTLQNKARVKQERPGAAKV